MCNLKNKDSKGSSNKIMTIKKIILTKAKTIQTKSNIILIIIEIMFRLMILIVTNTIILLKNK